MFRIIAIFLFTITSTFSSAQDFSNKGKDFFIAYPAHIDGTNSVMGIYITSEVNASGTIQVGPTATIPFTVTANQVTRKFIGASGTVDASNSYVYLSLPDDVKTNAAIRIIADKAVVVYTHIIRSARSGATLTLPSTVLGTEYIAPSHQNVGSSAGYGEIAVVATQPSTLVEITPSVTGRAGKPANVPFQIMLPNVGDVYQFQGVLNADISGTRIKSISTGGTGGCKPIAVFSATTWSAFDCSNASGGDNLYQQLFPLRTWGKKFITAPFINRPYDIYRIFISDPTTVVTAKLQGLPFPLNASNYNTTGKFYTIQTAFPVYIEADKPISVVQYIVSQSCKTGCGTSGGVSTCLADPEMVLLNPIEQTLSDVTFFSAHQNYVPAGQTQVTLHYVNVIIDKNYKSSVRIDNSPVAVGAFVDIPGTNYSYLQQDVSSSSAINPVHRITADTSFSAIVYGYGTVESYGYNGGTNVRDLYQYVTLQNQFASVNFPATCQNTPFNFAITLPYLATSLTWDFNNNPNLTPNNQVINNTPVPDSSFVRDGRTVYLYKLPGTYKFTAPGTYGVKVLANNPSPDGCTGIQEISYDVEVFASPTSNFSITHSGCLSDSVRFADASNGNGRPLVKWFWNFGDNTIDTIKNPGKVYQTAGTFNVAFRAITDIGCVADTIKPIFISSKPAADFKISGTLCPGSTINITDTSTIATGTIVKWYWNFGNGNTLVATNNIAPPQIYSTAGTYNITLQVESNSGCKSTIQQKQVVIHPLPFVDFNLPGVCLPSGVAQFQNLTTISNGSQLSFLWNFGDGGTDTIKNPVHVYTAPGPYSVMLQATSPFGCVKDSTKIFSNIFARPKAAFTSSSAQICVSDSVFFTDGSSAANNTVDQWFWDFGDGTTSNLQNPRKKYAAGNSYLVKLFIKSLAGCISDTAERTIVVNNLPIAIFTTSAPLCETRNITLTNQSTSSSGSVNSWFWNLGDGTTSTTGFIPFSHTYAAGTYIISLAVTSDKGCKSDSAFKTITVNALPQVNFILPVVCLSDAFATFNDSSFINDGTGNSFIYAWNFNDPNATPSNPNTSTLKNPQHKFSASGVYNVSLTVTSNRGCSSSVIKPFTVNGAVPDAQFNVLNNTGLCSNTAVSIQNKSVVDFGSVTRLEIIWNNVNAPAIVQADNAPAFDKIYSHNYPALQVQATYQVKVRAFSGGTCVDEIIKTIVVQPSPKVIFATISGICLDAAPRQLNIPLNGNVLGSGIFSGSGVSSTGLFNPVITGAGSHPIRYTYTSNTGCKDSAEAFITVWPSPTAIYNFNSPTCIGNSILFTDSSIANAGTIIKWNWDFAGTPDNRTNALPFTHTFNSIGSKAVSLQVITDSGCRSAVITKNVEVHAKPQVAFNLPIVCLPGGKAQFNDLSTIADNTSSQFSYVWNFGDANNSTSTIKNPIFNYSSLGPFMVKLQVTSPFGCIDSLAQSLTTIYPQPKAGFSFSPIDTCLGGNINFLDSSKSISGPITNWFWNFGDGSIASTPNPSKQYTAARSYTVSLHISNQQGCLSDTVSQQLIIYPYPVVNAGPDLFVLEGDPIVLQPQVTGNDLQYLWTPAIYLNKDTIKNPVSKPAADVLYKLTVTGRGNCKANDQVFIKLLKSLGIPNAFSPNRDGVNDTWVIQYLENYPGATVEIFDRYGQQVLMSYGYKNPWDGTFNGKPLPIGTYYYIINPKNGRTKYSGSITLLK